MQSEAKRLRSATIQGFTPAPYLARRKGARGRVLGGSRASIILTEAGGRSLTAFTKKRLKMVGWAKAAFAKCAKYFGGTRGLPQWVTRHREAPGFVDDNTKSQFDPSFRMRAAVPYIDKLLSPQTKAKAFYMVRRNIIAEIRQRLAKAAEKLASK